MIVIFMLVAVFTILFFGSIFTIKALNKAKLNSSIKKKMDSGKSSDAETALIQLINNNPYDITRRMELVNIYIQNKKFEDAINQLNGILKYSIKYPDFNPLETNKLIGECYLKADKPDEAVKVFMILKQENPDDPFAYVQLGEIEKDKGNLERALKYYSKASTLDPEDAKTLRMLGVLFYELKKYPEALTTLQTSLNKNPEDPATNYFLGELRLVYDNREEAFNHFKKSKNDPVFAVKSLLNIGGILHHFDKLDETQTIMVSLLKNPTLEKKERLEVRYKLADVLISKKDIPAAINQWEKILALDENYKDVKYKLEQYEHTKTSSILRAYMLAPRTDFINICKEASTSYAERVSIIRTEPQIDQSVEVFTQAVYHEHPTTILFKYFRGTSNVGGLAIREFYEKLKETKAKMGVCFATADYTEDAQLFSSGRVIELFGKNELIKLLTKLSK
jgi:tetratricopeptide (TPR) repeat protein